MKNIIDLKEYKNALEFIKDQNEILEILEQCHKNLKQYEKYDSIILMTGLLEDQMYFCKETVKHLQEQNSEK